MNLPDLRGKVKIEFSDLEAAALKAKLLGDALKKELGGSATTNAVKELGNAVEGVSKSSSSGIPVLTGLGSALGAVGSIIGGLVIPVLIGLVVALTPVIVLLGAFAIGLAAALSVVVIASGPVLALAAAVTLLAASTQGWLAATIPVPQAQSAVANATNAHQQAVLQLDATQKAYNATSQHTAAQTLALHQAQQKATDTALALTKAQNDLNAALTGAKNPLQQLKDDFDAMADRLGSAAVPAATALLGFLDEAIQPVELLGSAALHWFGQVLPTVLDLAYRALPPLVDGLFKLGGYFQTFFNQAISLAPKLGPLLVQTFGFIVDAAGGLLDNLVQLSSWFLDRLPTLGPIVAQIMGTIGSVIQGVGEVAGQVVDWFIANWPKIGEKATQVWNLIMQGWNAVKPMLQAELPAALAIVAGLMDFLGQHSDIVRGILLAVGAAAAVLVGAIVAVGVIVIGAVAALELLYEGFNKVNQAVSWVMDRLNDFIGLIGRAAAAIRSSGIGGVAGAIVGAATGGAGIAGFAAGGFALPGAVFQVGEQGPETGYAVPGGGVAIVPNSAGGGGPRDRRPDVTNDLLAQQNVLLASIDRKLNSPPFSNRAYG